MFLVTEVHSMDDIPILLTADRDEAFRAASEHEFMGEGYERWKRVFGTDASTPQHTKVIEFQGGVVVNVSVFNRVRWVRLPHATMATPSR